MVRELWVLIMDSEDAMNDALNRWKPDPEFKPDWHVNPEVERLEALANQKPVKPEDSTGNSSLKFDVFQLIGNMLNQLEDMGENIIVIDNDDSIELSGESQSLVYDFGKGQWNVSTGRNNSA